MKIKNSSSGSIWLGVITVIIILSLVLLPSGDLLASVTLLDDSGEKVNTDTLIEPKLNQLSQSLFGYDDGTEVFSLMSTVPATEEQPNYIFEANAKNPFDGESILTYATIYQNDVRMKKEIIDARVEKGESYHYSTGEIYVEGEEAVLNQLIILFDFKRNNEIRTQEFVFSYFSLTPCTSDDDCSNPYSKCDLGNLAGFSSEVGKFYCTMPCASSSQCPDNQICKLGVCGY